MNSDVVFKSALGGFKRTEVIDYIEKLQNEFFNYRRAHEENVRELNERICLLEAELDDLKGSCEQPVTAVTVQPEPVNNVKSVIDGLAENMNRLFAQMLEMAGVQDAAEEADEVEAEEEAEAEDEVEAEEEAEDEAEEEVEAEVEAEEEAEVEAEEVGSENDEHDRQQPDSVRKVSPVIRVDDDDDDDEFSEQIKKLISEYGTL